MEGNWAATFAGADRQLTDVYETIMTPHLFTPWAEVLADALDPDPGATVVDVATGPGTVARALARRVGVIGRVYGCDVSPTMIDTARAQPAEPGAAPVEYRVCPADALALDDGVVDGVACQHGLQFFPDRVAALTDMLRVTRPGGRLAVAVWAPIERSPIFAALAAGIGAVLGPDAAERYRGGPWAITDPDELRTLAARAGWHEVSVVSRELPIEFSHGAPQLVASLGITPLGARIAALDPADRNAVVEAVADALGPALDVDGAARSTTSALFLLAAA
jgi:SAM-dependent methyltransferase